MFSVTNTENICNALGDYSQGYNQLGGTLYNRIILVETGGAFRLPLNRQGDES
ncbi:hypothetical protein ANRL3_01404 [Anaerolineae bacterium]|nr:hypothetical protein ANRL3_01404 [Anaerolineae bacterium]